MSASVLGWAISCFCHGFVLLALWTNRDAVLSLCHFMDYIYKSWLFVVESEPPRCKERRFLIIHKLCASSKDLTCATSVPAMIGYQACGGFDAQGFPPGIAALCRLLDTSGVLTSASVGQGFDTFSKPSTILLSAFPTLSGSSVLILDSILSLHLSL